MTAERLFPDLLSCCRSGFRHMPDLERLILFVRRREPLVCLADQIDSELGRSPGVREVVLPRGAGWPAPGPDRSFEGLQPAPSPAGLQEIEFTELSHLLEADQVTPVALGLHGRRLVEQLMRHQLGWRRVGL